MKPAHELLRKLRAAGVELKPMAEGDIALVLEDALTGQRYLNEFAVRLAADLLEARAKLAEMRDWLKEQASYGPADGAEGPIYARIGREGLAGWPEEPRDPGDDRMNHTAAHVICDNPEHPAAQEAASEMILDWIEETSEECWCAGWMGRCEFDLYRLIQSGGGEYGMGEVTPEEASTLRALIEVGGWWRWDQDDEDGRLPIPPDKVAEWWAEAARAMVAEETEDDRSRPASREMALDAGDPDLEGWPT